MGKEIGKLLKIRSPECAVGEELETGSFFFFLIGSMGWYKLKSITEVKICVKTSKSHMQLLQIRNWLWVAQILGKTHTAQGFLGLIGSKYCNRPIRVGFQAA